MSLKQNDQYNEHIKDYLDETINDLQKEVNKVDKKVQKLLDRKDVINDCIVKIQSEILMNQTKWKLNENN